MQSWWEYLKLILQLRKHLDIILPYFGKRKQVTKVTFLVKEQNVSVISTGVNYYDVLPNISLSRMSVYAYNLAWKKSTAGKINNSNFDGMSLESDIVLDQKLVPCTSLWYHLIYWFLLQILTNVLVHRAWMVGGALTTSTSIIVHAEMDSWA